MQTIEAQAIIENTGDYDDYDVEYILETYEELMKNVGFEDNRHDKRYIVKFHDICYYTTYDENEEEEFWGLFDAFCEDQVEWIEDGIREEGTDTDIMLTRMNVGHYQAFLVDIPEITKDNAIELAMKIYDEVGYRGKEYVRSYIYMVNMLQDLEDNYMEYWFNFLEGNEYYPQETIDKMKEEYHKDIERRKATQTLAK